MKTAELRKEKPPAPGATTSGGAGLGIQARGLCSDSGLQVIMSPLPLALVKMRSREGLTWCLAPSGGLRPHGSAERSQVLPIRV